MKYRFSKKIKITYVKVMSLTALLAAFLLPSRVQFSQSGENLFDVYLNNRLVGQVGEQGIAKECLMQARKNLAATRSEMIFLNPELRLDGREVLIGEVSSEKEIVQNMEAILQGSEEKLFPQAYTVKIKGFTVNLGSIEEVRRLLQAAVDKYDSTESYRVELVQDTARELNVLTTQVFSEKKALEAEKEEEKEANDAGRLPSQGVFAALSESVDSVEFEEEKDLSEYNLGLINMNFGDTIEIVECYMPDTQLDPLEKAIEDVTKDQETNKIYEVVAGDTLGEIAESFEMTMEDLVAMNATLEDANSMIRVGDELIISVPEPELSVLRQEELYYEEDYDADVIYVDNDQWYTTDKVTLQQPSSGHRRVVAIVSYRNQSIVDTEIIKEEVILEAVPKIVERGTKIPPTYIKPISGGRLSSTFGRRKAPKRGASTYHQGVDWATPTGTAVVASCGGVVTRAGWGSGYGYVIYIKHPDGRETRYGHLSKVLVSVGQSVSQGQKIALSGNTGNSTGPHLHFEIRINGSGVDPLKYLN